MQQRSYKPELMDGPLEDPELLYANLEELVLINRLTGAYDIMFKKVKELLKGQSEIKTIVDVASGAGDFLHYLARRRHQFPCPVQLIGIDLEPHARIYADSKFPDLKNDAAWFTEDYRNLNQLGIQPDIITCSLFCHHLTDDEIISLFSDFKKMSGLGFIVNDLVRHPFAYHSILLLTKLFSKSEYTRNDAPLSVLRSFRKEELKRLLQAASIKEYAIIRTFFFRYIITVTADTKSATCADKQSFVSIAKKD